MRYQESLKNAWDSKAGNYDSHDRNGFLPQRMSYISLGVLRKYFKGNMKVLEIGCGTGVEAIELSKEGIRVVATDVSPGMIRAAEQKKHNGDCSYPDFRVAGAEGVIGFKQENFSGIYSLSGPLNCVSEMNKFAGIAGDILPSGGYFISSLINKYCLWEIMYNLCRADFETAFRRFSNAPVKVKLSQFSPEIEVHYYTPDKYYSFFKNNFVVREIIAMPLVLPPMYLKQFYERMSGLFDKLLKLEEIISGQYPFNRLGDHFLMVMQRR